MRCPGQDKRYWKDDAVFEVPCPRCAHEVEFFKDENMGRCHSCGHRFSNPKISLDCTEWCAYAEECVGGGMDRLPVGRLAEAALASRLVKAIEEEFKEKTARNAYGLLVFQHAIELASSEKGDPRVVLAAALLLGRKDGDSAAADTRVRQLLQRLGFEPEAVDRVCHVVDHCASEVKADTADLRIVRDADRLAKLAIGYASTDSKDRADEIANQFVTVSGKHRAEALFAG